MTIKDAVHLVEIKGLSNHCFVKRIRRKNMMYHWLIKTMVLINGQQCQIRLLQNIKRYKNKYAAYAVTTIHGASLAKTDFQIFIFAPGGQYQRCFIVPTEVLLLAYRFRDGRKIQIDIPIQKLLTSTGGYIDWWQYENAWYLLGGQRPEISGSVKKLAAKREFKLPPAVAIQHQVVQERSRLLVDNKKCAIRILRGIFRDNRGGGAEYFRTNLQRSTLLSTDFQIFALQLANEDKYFIVPSKVLIRSYQMETDQPRLIYIPRAKTMAGTKTKGILDWWPYADAWHLLDQGASHEREQ